MDSLSAYFSAAHLSGVALRISKKLTMASLLLLLLLLLLLAFYCVDLQSTCSSGVGGEYSIKCSCGVAWPWGCCVHIRTCTHVALVMCSVQQ
jgi:hypothetical protein